MITALDTNVLLDILIPNARFFDRSLAAILDAGNAGSLVICDPVYAELCGQFGSQLECDEFLGENRIGVDRISRPALWSAAAALHRYRKAGGTRERILTDFLIAAHASCQAARLISRDRGAYRNYFAELVLVDPSSRG